MQVMNAPSHSKYNALYLKAQKRFSHGISFLSSFSYGKSIDNGSGVRTSVGDPLTPSNNYDLALETGPSAFDFRKRWTTSWIYELPFGRDRKFMNDNTALDYVLGGWQIGGILTFQDGFPFTLGCSTGTVQNGGGGCYPDPAPGSPDWQLDDPTRERWFNTAAFVDRNPEYGTGFRYGTVKRNTVVGPGIKSFDMSFNKNFRIEGRSPRVPHRGIQPAERGDLGSARLAARHADLRRHHEHPIGLAAGSDWVEVRVLKRRSIGARGKGSRGKSVTTLDPYAPCPSPLPRL